MRTFMTGPASGMRRRAVVPYGPTSPRYIGLSSFEFGCRDGGCLRHDSNWRYSGDRKKRYYLPGIRIRDPKVGDSCIGIHAGSNSRYGSGPRRP